MAGTIINNPVVQFFNNNGRPLSGGKITTYLSNTTTPASTWQNEALNVLNTNPIILNSRGEATIWLNPGTQYTFVITDSDNNLIQTINDIYGGFQLVNGISAGDIVGLTASMIEYDPVDGGPTTTVQEELNRQSVTLQQFYLDTDPDWAAAAEKACLHCYQTGKTLDLQGGTYPGARIEVHGSFSVAGGGATVDYLGVGTTYIAGVGAGLAAVPTAWPNDPSYDPDGLFNPVMFDINVAASVGDNSVTLSSVVGLSAGMWLFLADKPTSASSTNNYIPTNFEFARIKSIAGNVVTFNGKLLNNYTTDAAAFYSPGLAVGCSIKDIKLSTTNDAYQHVVRSALNVTIENITFDGTPALGATTFAEGMSYKNLKASGAFGNIQTGRGVVSCFIDGLEWQSRTDLPAAEPVSVFIEESFYLVSVKNVKANGGALSIRVTDMTNAPVGKRRVVVSDSIFDTSYTTLGADSPLQCGTAAGFDFSATNTTFRGAVITPNGSIYPGVTGTAMMFVTANQAADTWTFSACKVSSTNSGASFKAGSGALGQFLFDELCTFETCDEPVTQYTPRGAWIPITLLGLYTPVGSYTAPAYRVQDKTVYFTGAIQINSAANADLAFTMPVGLRPPASKLLNAPGALTGGGQAGYVLLNIDTAGDVVPRWQAGVGFFGLEGVSYPLDI